MTECLVGRDVSRKLYQTMENVALLPSASGGGVSHSTNTQPPTSSSLQKRDPKSGGDSVLEQGVVNMSEFKRTTSLDAIRTGAKGLVRSNEWVRQTQQKQNRNNVGKSVVTY